jgi:myosin heavy subunit
VNRFNLLIEIPQPQYSPKEVVKRMMEALNIKPASYRIGISKLFLRRDVHEKLEEERSRLLVRQALTIQKICRGHIARNYVRFMRMLRLESAIQLQKQVRKILAQQWYEKSLQEWKAKVASLKALEAQPAEKSVDYFFENGVLMLILTVKTF